MTTVRHRSIGSYSGPVINGTVSAFDRVPNMADPHLGRAFWLTSMVESGGKLGTIMMADGTGCTASLEQVIAVYPRNLQEQGPLFKLLNRMDNIAPVHFYLNFEGQGWVLAEDGALRHKANGQRVAPKEIRDTFTPTGGKVPGPGSGDKWLRSKDWAIAFHQLFSLQQTARLQVRCGIEHITKFAKRYKTSKLNKETVEDLCYGGQVQNTDVFANCPELDLAMAFWWNYKTNAPSPALTALAKNLEAFSVERSPKAFAYNLIYMLRTSGYGRWATNRYDRTRQHAKKVWPKEFFDKDAIMPARRT
jgi:hypothetical protein